MTIIRRAFITAAALILAGCASNVTENNSLDKDLTCTVSVSGVRDYTAEVERVDKSGWRITMTAPESSKGIELAYMSDGNCTVTVQGHTIVYARTDIPNSGVFDLITSAADMCIENKGVTTETHGNRVVSTGKLRGMNFTAESENGNLTSLEIGNSIKAQFSYLPSDKHV